MRRNNECIIRVSCGSYARVMRVESMLSPKEIVNRVDLLDFKLNKVKDTKVIRVLRWDGGKYEKEW